jgi:phosphatidylglycerophosphate synthase
LVATAIIEAHPRSSEAIFGRTLLQRLVLIGQRAGVKRFFIEAPESQQASLSASLGDLPDSIEFSFVKSRRELIGSIAPDSSCVMISGNLVITAAQLQELIARHARHPQAILALESADSEHGGGLRIGPVSRLLNGDTAVYAQRGKRLPFALNHRREDLDEAELRLAQQLRYDSAEKDAPLARWLDRRLSWRISYRLARTATTANQVTLAATVLGLVSAMLFALPGYWPRVAASLIFLAATTADGVDGELARLKLVESESGARLDTLTDNLVHVALFAGIMAGCYRASLNRSYLLLLLVLLGGFAAFAVIERQARESNGEREWLAKLEQLTGRDFAYLLFLLAVLNSLYVFAWGAAFGTYVAAFLLWLAAKKRADGTTIDGPSACNASGAVNRGLLSELESLWRELAPRKR